MTIPDFDAATLPWVDRDSFAAELAARRAAGAVDDGDAATLESWNETGYHLLQGAVDPQLIDRLLAEYEDAWRTRPACDVLVEDAGIQPFAAVRPRDELTHHHYRVMDFQDVSPAAREIMLHPEVVRFLRLVFDDTPVAMQSLLFEYGSEQNAHQDFPYVQAQTLSHLVGCWVACEDVHPDGGPLFYYPGSHKIAKFDWGGGRLRWDGKDHDRVAAFESYVAASCAGAGLERRLMLADKGDVIFWHAALVHGGSPAADRRRTRKSLVSHYSTVTGYPRDRRAPDRVPPRIERNGGVLYLRQGPPGPLTRLRSLLGRVKRKILG
jgi:ectoine hydroxylase-related dioxygenase (phytanoyl-CoA dioxygenase family)